MDRTAFISGLIATSLTPARSEPERLTALLERPKTIDEIAAEINVNRDTALAMVQDAITADLVIVC